MQCLKEMCVVVNGSTVAIFLQILDQNNRIPFFFFFFFSIIISDNNGGIHE